MKEVDHIQCQAHIGRTWRKARGGCPNRCVRLHGLPAIRLKRVSEELIPAFVWMQTASRVRASGVYVRYGVLLRTGDAESAKDDIKMTNARRGGRFDFGKHGS